MADILIYSSAFCPYCVAAKNFLKSRGLEWRELRIDMDNEARQTMMNLTKRTSVPQIFINDTHVGGFDDMVALDRSGKFQTLLDQKS
jgi:glutaredoxin 3